MFRPIEKIMGYKKHCGDGGVGAQFGLSLLPILVKALTDYIHLGHTVTMELAHQIESPPSGHGAGRGVWTPSHIRTISASRFVSSRPVETD